MYQDNLESFYTQVPFKENWNWLWRLSMVLCPRSLPSSFCVLSLCVLGTWRSNYVVMTLLFSSSDWFCGSLGAGRKQSKVCFIIPTKDGAEVLYSAWCRWRCVCRGIVCTCFSAIAIQDISRIYLLKPLRAFEQRPKDQRQEVTCVWPR